MLLIDYSSCGTVWRDSDVISMYQELNIATVPLIMTVRDVLQ